MIFKGEIKMSSMRFLCISILSVCLTCSVFGKANEKFIVGVYSSGESTKASVSKCVNVFEKAGVEAVTVEAGSIAGFKKDTNSVLVITPETLISHDDLKPLDEYLSAKGNLMLLSAKAFDYANYTPDAKLSIVSQKTLLNAAKISPPNLKVIKDKASRVTDAIVQGEKKSFIKLHANDSIGGSAFIEVPVVFNRDPDKYCFEMQIKGDWQFDILTAKLIDHAGNVWTGFCDAKPEWKSCRIAVADMLLEKKNSDNGLSKPKTAKLQIGLDSRVLWGESCGQIKLSKVNLLEYNEIRRISPGRILDFQTQYNSVKAKYPDWFFDPLRGTTKFDLMTIRRVEGLSMFAAKKAYRHNGLWQLPNSYPVRGGDPRAAIEIAKQMAYRSIPLLGIYDDRTGKREGLAGRIDVMLCERYKGASVMLLPIGLEVMDNEGFVKMMLKAAEYMALSPKILESLPAIFNGEDKDKFGCKVSVYNPQQKDLNASMILKINSEEKRIDSSLSALLKAKLFSQHNLISSQIDKDFNLKKFNWDMKLLTDNFVDEISDEVDVAVKLREMADVLLGLQSRNHFAGYSHWFYSDAYAARMLFAMGCYDNNYNYINSALRWADEVCSMQNSDGALAMGYGQRRGIYYTADGGSIALGLLQIGAKAKFQERTRYLEAAKKYFNWRKTFLITEELSKKLKARFGNDAKGVAAGNYGIGMVVRDHVDGSIDPVKVPRKEERGTWYTLACSMSTSAALAVIDGADEYVIAAKNDTENYLTQNMLITSSYAPEGILWAYKYSRDEEPKAKLKDKLTSEFLPFCVKSKENYWQEHGSRQMLLLNPMIYCMRNFDNSPAVRAAVLKTVWGICDKNSPYSVLALAGNYPKCTFSIANNEAIMYLSFAGFGLMELLEADSTIELFND
jgi:hypothetical protein